MQAAVCKGPEHLKTLGLLGQIPVGTEGRLHSNTAAAWKVRVI